MHFICVATYPRPTSRYLCSLSVWFNHIFNWLELSLGLVELCLAENKNKMRIRFR